MPTTYQPTPGQERIDLTNRIKIELRRLHISGNLKGFYYLVYALEHVVPDALRLSLITKDLYPETGRHFGVSTRSVERAIRTAIASCWNRGGRETLDEMACTHLTERPCATEFIDIVADYIRRTI